MNKEKEFLNCPWRPDEPCPCGKPNLFKDCCLEKDGQIRVKLPKLLPPLPLTGYGHPKCYLSCTQNCSEEISKEHYISKALLEQFRQYNDFNGVELFGMPWLPAGTPIKIGVGSAIAYILCESHNNFLSPLDSAASAFFRTITDINVDLQKPLKGGKDLWYLISEEALELWSFKTLCGIFYGEIAARERNKLIKDYSLDIQKFIKALESGHIEDNCGLYLKAKPGQKLMGNYTMGFAPLSNDEHKKVIGIRLNMHGYEFEIFMDPFRVNFDEVKKEHTYRPQRLIFNNGQRKHTVLLASPTTSGKVEFTMHLPPGYFQ